MESQDERYLQAAAAHGPALERLVRAYESDPSERDELIQDIHFALWRSLAVFDGRCSLRTWLYRVAHNTAASHVLKRKRTSRLKRVSLEELEQMPDGDDPERSAGERQLLDRLLAMINTLRAADAQVMLLYLEDLDAAEIGEITGLSAGAVATKIHRIKALLGRRFKEKDAAA